jgi:hypothetical protein
MCEVSQPVDRRCFGELAEVAISSPPLPPFAAVLLGSRIFPAMGSGIASDLNHVNELSASLLHNFDVWRCPTVSNTETVFVTNRGKLARLSRRDSATKKRAFTHKNDQRPHFPWRSSQHARWRK